MENIINIGTPTTDYYDSYGQKLCELVRGLAKRGVYANVIPLAGELVRDNQPDDVRALLARPVRPALGGIMMGYPTAYHKYPDMLHAGPTVAITAWESTITPVGWVEALNRVDAVSVGSQFTRDVLIKAGVNGQRVYVHPLGVSDAYQYIERPRRRRPFTFLTLAGNGRRKGWDVALLAFWRAFGDNPDFKLIIKARTGKFPFAPQAGNVEVIRQDMTQAELADLFGRVEAFVFPTRGEGFGLPPREAAATGLPVICTKWSGTADDLVQWGYPIRYTLVDAWTDNPHMNELIPAEDREFPPKLGGLGQWAEPDADHLAEQMIHVATGPMVRQVAAKSARNVRRLYNWQRFADQVLDTYQREAAKYPLSQRRKQQRIKEGRITV